MKELSIEEKARRYDEAIEIAKDINNEQQAQPFNVMTRVFPELTESEDERIRKSIIELLNEVHFTFKYYDINKMLAWLEKQGEQKPVDTAKQEMSDEEYCSLCMDINCDGCLYVDKSKHKEQKPVEWSEEDETVRNDIIAKLAILKSRAVDGGAEKEICEMEINWLKSLRPQSTWKPSDEQIEVLEALVEDNNQRYFYTTLNSLYEQLKKLKG